MKLVAVPTRVEYSVELTREQFDRLETHDFLDEVCPIFKALNVCPTTIEYSGHFGSAFYFTLDSEYEVQPVLDALEKLVSPRKSK
jgi:hypothetical protein